jgi:hypothetical protein
MNLVPSHWSSLPPNQPKAEHDNSDRICNAMKTNSTPRFMGESSASMSRASKTAGTDIVARGLRRVTQKGGSLERPGELNQPGLRDYELVRLNASKGDNLTQKSRRTFGDRFFVCGVLSECPTFVVVWGL